MWHKYQKIIIILALIVIPIICVVLLISFANKETEQPKKQTPAPEQSPNNVPPIPRVNIQTPKSDKPTVTRSKRAIDKDTFAKVTWPDKGTVVNRALFVTETILTNNASTSKSALQTINTYLSASAQQKIGLMLNTYEEGLNDTPPKTIIQNVVAEQDSQTGERLVKIYGVINQADDQGSYPFESRVSFQPDAPLITDFQTELGAVGPPL